MNFVLPGRQPLLDDVAVVDPEGIDDQDDFALPIFDQLPEELDEDVRINPSSTVMSNINDLQSGRKKFLGTIPDKD